MSDTFRELLKKVGSGSHTSKNLTRAEAASATEMMLTQTATPAQIGAFMIAHRIRRPTPTELAGMLDCYDQLGPRLQPIGSKYPVTVFSSPYDGRTRTAPVSPLTALVLAAAEAPAVLHGSDRMPTKYGLPFIEVWQALGLNWQLLTLDQVQTVFEQTGLGFVYQPEHFPAAQGLVPYRDQLGKRPPLATIELMWSPYNGPAHVVSSYVHPPTEERTQQAYAQRGTNYFTTVKGVEGSCDLPRARTAIIGLQNPDTPFERLLLHPRDFGFADEDPPLGTPTDLQQQMKAVLAGQLNSLANSVIWNGGFYLWRSGVTETIDRGLALSKDLLLAGRVKEKANEIAEEITHQSQYRAPADAADSLNLQPIL
ncbi:MAG: anthranilate phosphoribosyltransferase family protein [Cyanobacteria bacterium J06648_16]